MRLDLSNLIIDRTLLFEVAADAGISTLLSVAEFCWQEFAAGLELGEPEFDMWLKAERSRCRERAIRLLDRLVRALSEVGRYAEALAYANRLAEIDPLREETHRLVISAEAMASGRASAMARFEQFRLMLKEELEVRPEAATLQILDTLRRTRNGVEIPGEVLETRPNAESMTSSASPVLDGSPNGARLDPVVPARSASRRSSLLATMVGVLVALVIALVCLKAMTAIGSLP